MKFIRRLMEIKEEQLKLELERLNLLRLISYDTEAILRILTKQKRRKKHE